MTQSAITSGAKPGGRPSPFEEQLQQRRKNRLMGYLHKGLPTLPAYLLDLNALLSSAMVDLKKVGRIIRTDPSLTAQVLRLCNSALFGLRRRVLSIEQAAVLLGTERLRTLVLTCAVMQFAGKHVPVKSLLGFWEHSFLAALLSERVARFVDYPEKEQAYLGGLLHDIGQLPLWMLVMEEAHRQRELPPDNWPDNIPVEREFFGMDHGKVGRWLAVSWNFMPSFMDVFEHHHHPENAQHDPYLVAIVSAVDQFLQAQALAELETPAQPEPAEVLAAPPEPAVIQATEAPAYLAQCFSALSPEEHLEILETLRTEYIHVLPLVQLGIAAVAPAGATESISIQEKKL
ncbi:MAG TPA: HDOD domain-containing protein [Candidatus Sulfotelmatobacter sp.]|nr:HDOD domain-containing protein [Candidatus Sulfotelmatobacter sp.]